MDLHELPHLAFSGLTLNVEERSGLDLAMRKRQLDENLETVLFWGKISGQEADYLIVYGYPPSTEFPRKQFYACSFPSKAACKHLALFGWQMGRSPRSTSRRYELQAFPELSQEFAEKSAAMKGPFKGDPTFLLEEDEDDDEADDEAENDGDEGDEEEGSKKPKKVKFSEFHRLVHAVHTIDHDTSIVPRGAFILPHTRYITKNGGFTGLTASEAADPSNYLHFRAPESTHRRRAVDKDGMVSDVDFLDPVHEDVPKGCWSFRVDMATGHATARSLLWPGFFFFHQIGSSRFGGCYFGDGVKNTDLAFMM